MSTTSYLIVQAIGFVGTILFFASFQFKENRTLFRVQFFSYLFYTTHLLLLGATTGAISYVINTVRSICLGSSSKLLRSRRMGALLCLLQLGVLWVTWDGWISILPVAANIASTIGGYTHNARSIRIAGMFVNSPLWIIYDIIVGSWAGIADELVSEASMIISVARFGWKGLEEENDA
ncbi:MAG: YgjV family protein [Anaerovoracaceae bacterium]